MTHASDAHRPSAYSLMAGACDAIQEVAKAINASIPAFPHLRPRGSFICWPKV
jgi:hypothetical protein